MAGHRDTSDICIKEDVKKVLKCNVDIFDKSCDEEEEEDDIKNDSFGDIVKRYSKYDLLSLRNGQISLHYPHCALRPELQALSIWTCRLRCELQYLGLWKIPNTGNSHVNCSCNGSCQSYACGDGQQYLPSNAQLNALNSQICYGNAHQSQQLQPLQPSSSPTLGSKRAVRSRERSLNYQRCINTELIHATSPTGGGESSLQHNTNQQMKPTFIDHRSISSSHLMPAFAKRRMVQSNTMLGKADAGSNVTTEHLSNDDGAGESSTHFEMSTKSRKDSNKAISNQNDYHLYKTSGNSRLEKNDQLFENQSGWMNLVKKNSSEFSSSNNKANNTSSSNKKLIYERRIGSGRLVPRVVSWDMRAGGNNQIDKDNGSHLSIGNNVEKDKDIISSGEGDKLYIRNSVIGRYTDARAQERRIFDRRISNSEDLNNGGSSNTSKRYVSTNMGDEKNNFDSHYHQQTSNFTGQRSMSFRRREYVEHKDNHRDFRESKDSRESREKRGDHHHNSHRDNKEEPEWFSEGPTSQHDTIELRGFEETDETQQEQPQSCQYTKIQRKSSESSLLSHNSSSNVNLSAKENVDISSDLSNNSNNTFDKDVDNCSSCNNVMETATPNQEISDTNEATTDTQQIIFKPEKFENSDKRRSDVTELFFDNFLNIEALENSLIGSANDQSVPANNDGGGTSRFSRWFFNNSNTNQNIKDEFNNNPHNKEDINRINKDMNESNFKSFLTFLQSNNFPTPELPKVSALSVEELEARMRKMDSGDNDKSKSDCVGQNLHKNNSAQIKKSECKDESDPSPQSTEIKSQDIEAFRKLLDQLGKPRVDISMNIILPKAPGTPHPLPTPVGTYPIGISPVTSNSCNMTKQEYMMKFMHPQQLLHHHHNAGKTVTPLNQHHHAHHRITQMSPQQQTENLPLMSVPHHPHTHHMSMVMGHTQKRIDVQHLIQSVIREDLSRSFLEKELKNPNISPYTKEIISTVLKETSRYNPTAGAYNAHDSGETKSNNDITAAPNILMQSLARGEVSLNLLEHELNKLNNTNVNETICGGSIKEKSRCVTPLASSMNVVSIPTSGVVVPLTQAVPAQKQNLALTKENVCAISSDQQQGISSILRSHQQEDSAMQVPTQRELQMHTQAIMQNALFKKKMEIDQHELLRRRQEMHKQKELESASISQQHQQHTHNSSSTISFQGHQQTSRHINSPTPLAFTPTSVLRKMTAEKDTSSTQVTTMNNLSPQQIQPHLQEPHLKIPSHPQLSYQHSNQPRMILGGGNFQYMHQHHQIPPTANGSPQVSPQQKSQIRNQPPVPLKWPLITHPSIESNHTLLNSMSNKPMGRPILKGPGPVQPLVPQNVHSPVGQSQSNINQNSQPIQTVSQMQKYPTLQQQPRQIVGQQFSTHIIQHQIPTSQQNNMQQQLYHQQRLVVLQRQQIQQNDLGNHAPLPPAHHPACNDSNVVTNLGYQRDGGLSPTSNQLAQWFSPELLAQASAGKLPLLNMNQALSLEEFERSIQHSSTAVNN